MTIAIGSVYSGGVVLCADSKAVATDGATTSDRKMSRVYVGDKARLVIADAAEDANAAKMLRTDILRVAYEPLNPDDPKPEIKAVMQDWYHSYRGSPPPHLQFLLARVTRPYDRLDNARIYLCEPPSTVVESWETISIGQGSRAVDPLLDLMTGVISHDSRLKATIMRLAFLMYRAKKDEGSACGGFTDMVILSNKGTWTTLQRNEMVQPEQLAAWMDHLMTEVGEAATSCVGGNYEEFLTGFGREFLDLARNIEKLQFPSLESLEHGALDSK